MMGGEDGYIRYRIVQNQDEKARMGTLRSGYEISPWYKMV